MEVDLYRFAWCKGVNYYMIHTVQKNVLENQAKTSCNTVCYSGKRIGPTKCREESMHEEGVFSYMLSA